MIVALGGGLLVLSSSVLLYLASPCQRWASPVTTIFIVMTLDEVSAEAAVSAQKQFTN